MYMLGRVPAGYELYREVSGDQEDKPIPNGKEQVQLREDEHFHSGEPHKKEFTIIVNARKKTVTAKELTFEQIVALAFDPVPANSIFTVTYRGGEHGKDGILEPGQKVKIKECMIFYVTETGKS